MFMPWSFQPNVARFVEWVREPGISILGFPVGSVYNYAGHGLWRIRRTSACSTNSPLSAALQVLFEFGGEPLVIAEEPFDRFLHQRFGSAALLLRHSGKPGLPVGVNCTSMAEVLFSSPLPVLFAVTGLRNRGDRPGRHCRSRFIYLTGKNNLCRRTGCCDTTKNQ